MEGHEFDFTHQQQVDAFGVTDGIPSQDEFSNGHSHLAHVPPSRRRSKQLSEGRVFIHPIERTFWSPWNLWTFISFSWMTPVLSAGVRDVLHDVLTYLLAIITILRPYFRLITFFSIFSFNLLTMLFFDSPPSL